MSKRHRPEPPPVPSVDRTAAVPTHCHACQGTESQDLGDPQSDDSPGVDLAGVPYLALVRQWRACLECGQTRVDRTYAR